jgi:TM2 domain-containing membrane protein YozV
MAKERDRGAAGTAFPVAEAALDPMAVIQADPSKKRRWEAHRKSVAKAYLLWLLLGWFGGHRFYLGYINSAIFLIMMSSLGLLLMLIDFVGVFLLFAPGLWLLVDAFIIPAIVRHHNDELVDDLLR